MADDNTIQLDNLRQDIETLGNVVNGSPVINGTGIVTTRLGREVPSLSNLINQILTSPPPAWTSIVSDTQGARGDAITAKIAAEAARDEAQTARDVAVSAGPYYPDKTSGEGDTSDGEIFAVADGGGSVSWYRNDNGSGTFLFEIDSGLGAALSASGGAALIGIDGGGTVQDAIDSGMGSIPPVTSFGDTDTPANVLAALQAGQAQEGSDGTAFVDAELKSSADPGLTGLQLSGQKALYYDDGGSRRVINHVGRDRALTQWGQEYLVHWLNKVAVSGTSATVGIVGSGAAELGFGADLEAMLNGLPGVTVTNHAIANTTMEQWRTGTGDYATGNNEMASVVAAGYDLIVMDWGSSELIGGDGLAEFATTLNTAMAAIRGDVGLSDTSIVMLTGNAQNDSTQLIKGKRDELWQHQIRPLIAAACERFGCAFFDSNAQFPDAFVDTAGDDADTWLNSGRTMAVGVHKAAIVARLYDFLVPPGARPASHLSSFVEAKIADLPETYARGITIQRGEAAFGATGGAGQTNYVLTVMPLQQDSDGAGLQIAFNGNGLPIFRMRTSVSGSWGSFNDIGISSKTSTLASTAITDYPYGDSVHLVTTNNGWPVTGYGRTFRHGNQGWQEIMSTSNNVPMQRRTYFNGGWSSWYSMV